MCHNGATHDDQKVDKRTMVVSLKLSEEDVELFRRAGEALYGKDHPVPRSTLIRELARRASREITKKTKKHR